MKVTFHLTKVARKSGGDKYTAENDENFNIYLPQTISRKKGVVHKILVVTIEVKDNGLLISKNGRVAKVPKLFAI